MEPQCPVGHGDGLEIMDQGLTDGSWLVAFWLFFSLIHLRLSWTRPLHSHAVASLLACTGAHPESPPLPQSQSRTPVVGARTHSFQVKSGSSHPRPCQTLSSPPVGLSFLIQPPTDCRQPPTGHRHPETRSAPFTDTDISLISPSAPLNASSFSFASKVVALRPSRECLLAATSVSQTSHVRSRHERAADGRLGASLHLICAGCARRSAIPRRVFPAQAGTSRLWVFFHFFSCPWCPCGPSRRPTL